MTVPELDIWPQFVSMEKINHLIFVGLLLLVFATISLAQSASKYSHDAQKKMLPAELGRVYLGMPLMEFIKHFDLSRSETGDIRFAELSVTVPVNKGNVTELTFKIAGLSEEEKAAVLVPAKVTKKFDDGEEYEADIYRIDPAKVSSKPIVYELIVSFRPDFDLKSWALKTYGNKGTVRTKTDPYHFYDIEWNFTTNDKLLWLVRSLHENGARTIRLAGRIPGTEWAIETPE